MITITIIITTTANKHQIKNIQNTGDILPLVPDV